MADDPADAAADALTAGQVGHLVAALRHLADETHTTRTLLAAHLDADRGAVEARRRAWDALSGFASSLPGRGLMTLLGVVLAAGLARALGLDADYIAAVAGAIIPG
ncbi:MAG: hypothetical protein ACO3UW_12815 [Candidatus Nanopelagicales bacterium]